ncbi:hypothetical protein AB3S75_005474 [Citrus x aurantiifolia]
MYIRSTKNYLLYSFPGEVSLRLRARIQMPAAAGFSSRFYNATAGQDSDRVYGLFLRRGDLGSSACQDSVTFAARNVNIKISFCLVSESPFIKSQLF